MGVVARLVANDGHWASAAADAWRVERGQPFAGGEGHAAFRY